ncbi:NAD-dependent epimerase/dehydratase family protein [Vagococcus fluvialis]|uniref:NAD-dependent epimerase/dehydratase family protein n=1 Tax=Vagococcus fluvialis TaxID=2738 RepID=UPI001D0B218B|nr:NAD-dependent epimerase/dehydratase family protein [Vagococcus fluvialis]UDM70622.1 NAD-dependent epimerase/dehydratase family protein [Vagococcus fluvialis]UDM78042.1 NAD-dependent epimerase/dehydratase family protein [Vagococcus fluvialis]UDM82311.1 NAD-dependent epimerase/dehydratase family protein [Vagococcus fluvialis]
MKRILVTGENSYIGTSFVTYMEQFKEEYEIETISVRGDEWREKDFSIYDAIYHVAGLAHQKETKKNKLDYYNINTKLTKEIAIKAKCEGVNHFLYLSSMSVYGLIEGEISRNTEISPTSHYGKSKRLAEIELKLLEDINFSVAIIRPPMVYGKDCKGNYQTLSNFSKKTIFFPKIENERSVIYIDNLNMVVKEIILNQSSGYFHPQNSDYMTTYQLVQIVSEISKRRVFFTNKMNFLVNFMKKKVVKIKKVFGSLKYSSELVSFPELELISFEDSIILTESKEMKNE